MRVGRDGDLELARQVREIAVAEEEPEDFLDERARVEKFLCVDTGQRVAENRARHIAAGLDGAQARGLEPRQDVHGIAQGDVVDLHGLTYRDLDLALAVRGGKIREDFGLRCRQLARRQLDAHEKVAVTRPLGVDARPLEALNIARVNLLEILFGERGKLLEDLEPVLLVFPLFIAVGHTISPVMKNGGPRTQRASIRKRAYILERIQEPPFAGQLLNRIYDTMDSRYPSTENITYL